MARVALGGLPGMGYQSRADRSSVPVALDDDGGKCGRSRPDGGPTAPECGPGAGIGQAAFPLVWVRARVNIGMSEAGNQQYAWRELVSGAESIAYETREEWSDQAGQTIERATVTFAYGSGGPEIRETAMVRTGDQKHWRVTKAHRSVDTYTLTLTRVDDDGAP